MCIFFEQGTCAKGQYCTYAHDPSEIGQQSSGLVTMQTPTGPMKLLRPATILDHITAVQNVGTTEADVLAETYQQQASAEYQQMMFQAQVSQSEAPVPIPEAHPPPSVQAEALLKQFPVPAGRVNAPKVIPPKFAQGVCPQNLLLSANTWREIPKPNEVFQSPSAPDEDRRGVENKEQRDRFAVVNPPDKVLKAPLKVGIHKKGQEEYEDLP